MYYEQEKKASLFSILIKILISFGGLFLGFILCRIFILSFTISDNSMEPGLKAGDKIFILKHITPEKGNIILIESPVEHGRVLVKRIIASEGDTIEIRNKIFYINKKKIRFEWKTISVDSRIFPMCFTYRDNMAAVKIKRNRYFIIGDNIDSGFDSRTFGTVDRNLIIGRMIYKL